MKERPILFSGPMVRAILAGTKTQTRRVMDPQPHPLFLARGLVGAVPQWPHQNGVRFFMADGMSELVTCPHGAPGDRLWVREAWAPVPWNAGAEKRIPENDHDAQGVRYRATWDRAHGAPWRPSIHMPRWGSRLTLQITAVRVERLHDISETDIAAEGVTAGTPPCLANLRSAVLRDGWEKIWKETAGVESWNANPWVWALEFKRVR